MVHLIEAVDSLEELATSAGQLLLMYRDGTDKGRLRLAADKERTLWIISQQEDMLRYYTEQ